MRRVHFGLSYDAFKFWTGAMRFTTRRYFTWIWWTYCPPAGSMAAGSLRRWLQVTAIWSVLFPLSLWHRLCLALDQVLFPAFARVVPRRPLFIVGVPRSGTTLVQRLLAVDPRFTTMPMWELVLAPALVEKYFLRAVARVDRIFGSPLARGARWLERRTTAGLGSIHPTSLWSPEEDYLSLLPLAACFILIHPFPFTELWALVRLDRDVSPAERGRLMGYYRGIVQRHLYFRGVHRTYLGKNPTFTGAIAALEATFPDCCIVGCVREPGEAAGSLINSMTWGAVSFGNRCPEALLRDPLRLMLRDYFEILVALHRSGQSRRSVVRFDELRSDPGSTVLGLLARFGYDDSVKDSAAWTDALRASAAYVGRHQYDLRDYAIDVAELRRDFAFAIEEFGWN